MNTKIRLLLILIGIFIIYPLTIMLLSRLFTPIGYGEALLYSFVVRVVKWNWINKINK